MTVQAKICGLNDAAGVDAAAQGGAAFIGFVFFARSPRAVTPEAAAPLIARAPKGIVRVGLIVDADDATIRMIVDVAKIDMLQLHGGETPARVAEIKKAFRLPVMKALPIATAADIDGAAAYEDAADRLMFDARPPKDATRPGGNALAFDWSLLKGRRFRRPWILAGGLNAANVAEAVATSGANTVDVSSGVEDAPGRKNPEKILEFLKVVSTL